MSESKFEIGDVVALKSGGPKMTIVYIEPDQVRTCWFDGPHPLRDCFNPLALDVYQGEAAPSAGLGRLGEVFQQYARDGGLGLLGRSTPEKGSST